MKPSGRLRDGGLYLDPKCVPGPFQPGEHRPKPGGDMARGGKASGERAAAASAAFGPDDPLPEFPESVTAGRCLRDRRFASSKQEAAI